MPQPTRSRKWFIRDRGLTNMPFWLDNAFSIAAEQSAMSYLGFEPLEVFSIRADAPRAESRARLKDFLKAAELSQALTNARLPRWVGYLSYDLTFLLGDQIGLDYLTRHAPEDAAYLAYFERPKFIWRIDHRKGNHADLYLMSDVPIVCQSIQIEDVAAFATGVLSASSSERPLNVSNLSVEPEAPHLKRIAQALERIGEGDIYQANLARRWTAQIKGDPFDLFLRMRKASPVPLGAYLSFEDHAVLSLSMERFLKWERRAQRLFSRPIKGTIKRSSAHVSVSSDDEDIRGELLVDPKERAEHTMIVDLVRNDLGHVAKSGTVTVTSAYAVEPYARLSHLVSTVECQTRDEVTLWDVLCATFPPGSVTGCPKIRAIQRIDELESSNRGVYCGGIGFIDTQGGLSLSVAIRTAQVRDGKIDYFAGGGIVIRSDPQKEMAETELKARVFLDALTKP